MLLRDLRFCGRLFFLRIIFFGLVVLNGRRELRSVKSVLLAVVEVDREIETRPPWLVGQNKIGIISTNFENGDSFGKIGTLRNQGPS